MLRAFAPAGLPRLLQNGPGAPLAAGLIWRLVAAASGFGWFAIDDYLFVIEKAGIWQSAPQTPFGCAYRSTLVPRLMSWLLRWGHMWVGPDPAWALQVAYGVLGVASSLSILAVYEIARLGRHAGVGRTSAWLAACYVIMPRICTRALLESIAMLPVSLSVWALMHSTQAPSQSRRQRHSLAFLSAALCGLGAMVRFQVGILMLPLALWTWHKGGRMRVCSFVAGAGAAALGQAALDYSEGRLPGSTPWAYVHYNLHHASQYGTSPIYTYVLQCLVLALPPACLLIGPKAFFRAACQHRLVALLCGWFVGVHSLIAHKEDRFLFPILPLLWVLLGDALTPATEPSGGPGAQSQHTAQRRLAWGRRLFWTMNAAGLVVCSLSDAQRNWTVPLLHIAKAVPKGQTHRLVVIEPDVVPSYYLAGRVQWQGFADVPQFYEAVLRSGALPDYVLLRDMPKAPAQAMLGQLGCRAPQRFEGDFVDRLLVRLNRHNLRRAATTLLRCSPNDLATRRKELQP